MDSQNPTYSNLIAKLKAAPPWALALINTFLPVAARQYINYVHVMHTGQTTSYATKDDGYLQYGRYKNFTTLLLNNKFGNLNRFTDENGAQSYPSNYIIDHATGLGWCNIVQSINTWAAAVGAYSTFSLTVGTRTFTDFFLPNILQQFTILNFSSTNPLNYAPFNFSTTSFLWSSTTNPQNSGNAFGIDTNNNNIPIIDLITKSIDEPYILCRRHY